MTTFAAKENIPMAENRVLSVQLFSVRDRLATDLSGTLADLAKQGFRFVEPFGLGSPGLEPGQRVAIATQVRGVLDGLGLGVSAVHAGLTAADDLAGSVELLARECREFGTDTVFVPHPRLVPGHDENSFADANRVTDLARVLTEAADRATDLGLRLGYHNHWFEWSDLGDGTTGYQRFWSAAGSALLAEVDMLWARVAGQDPGAVVAGLGDRVAAVHLKDGPSVPGAPQTPLGTGVLNVSDLQGAVKNIPWHVVEIDLTEGDPLDLLGRNAHTLVEQGISQW
ncbi:sugar phosphate isomerase/epimerase family protein [Kibdelosporangium aridum]|uniref:sugar phosphate isomerase/epimerase family protein n=1 Tax=Kibdelosporangium aridum TaxID=2030 RepID=UPI0035F0AB96